MSGYNNPPPGGYGNPPPGGYNYGAPPPPSSQPYSAPPYASPAPPPSHVQSHHHQPSQQPPYAQPSAPSAPYKPPKDGHGPQPPYASPPAGYGSQPYAAPGSGSGSQPYAAPGSGYGSQSYPPPAGYGSPFAALVPSAFPPGTDPNVVACFQMADQDGSGFIDDKELQRALSSYNQSFSLRTVHLLMYLFTNSNAKKIGPKEFTSLFYSLQSWRGIFEKFDRDRSGRIDMNELREALLSLGFSVSPVVLDLLVSKFDKSGGRSKSIEYDNFIECCLTVKGLTEKFKEKDTMYSGSATFSYEAFMLTVLPFIIA